MKEKPNKFLLYAATSFLVGMVMYALGRWNDATNHADRLDWMIVVGMSACGAIYGVVVLLGLRSKPQPEAAAHDE